MIYKLISYLASIYDPVVLANLKLVFKWFIFILACLVIYVITIPSTMLVDAITDEYVWAKYKYAYKTIHLELKHSIFCL